ncbi:histidine kinase [Azorhizobium oxalatiphilum]|uniref:histidine kinase n=1 Tax=Azorhizobium oxalatiphilum TaxID=980631 RepID=A0A917C1H6_9HYPH|nr:ATP-binding protein [Azorhizobium oxalatiphilum]GGF65376.1 histidine kinase [Azorhizobium oxalatiphilum]
MTVSTEDAVAPTPSRPRRPLNQAVVLGAGFGILILISVISVFLVNRAREDAAQVAQTLLLENTISNLQAFLLRGETSQRGFLLTGDSRYLADFDTTMADLDRTIQQVQSSTVGASERRRALADRLAVLLQTKQDELRHTISLRRSGDTMGALAVVRTDRGEELSREIGSIINQMHVGEQNQLGERISASRSSNLWLMLVNLAGAVAIVGIAALALRITRRNTEDLRTAHHNVEEANLVLEQRVAERTADLQEANNEIQSFAYIVSHDLRSPLVNIMGFTSELEALRTDLFDRIATLRAQAGDTNGAADIALDKDFEEAFGFIKKSITKMDRLINAILDLSRQGRKEFAPTSVSMTEMVETIAATMAHQLMERNARLTVHPIPAIVSDRMALEQIFTNLIDNAVKYLRPDVQGLIEVSARETPGYVTYLVRDNGRGIDPNDRVRVFELFRRSGPQDRPGEGIGLAHVRALVRRLGGGITLESELGLGTVFKVTLPRRLVVEGNGGKHA